MVGPRGDERVEEAGEQAGEEAENEHQNDERDEGCEFDGGEIGEGGRGDAGARTVEDALPKSQEEEGGGEEAKGRDGGGGGMEAEDAAENEDFADEAVETGETE